jgi:aromatic ring-opening dioxygenase LigB subunit
MVVMRAKRAVRAVIIIEKKITGFLPQTNNDRNVRKEKKCARSLSRNILENRLKRFDPIFYKTQ